MEKYYDLIVSLIKQHRKYSGCENILEDIVNDVYEHAKVVMGTVDNEDVLKSYLEKIVATSMITVPKKLGISHQRQSKIVLPEIKDTTAEPEVLTDIETTENIISDTFSESIDNEGVSDEIFEELIIEEPQEENSLEETSSFEQEPEELISEEPLQEEAAEKKDIEEEEKTVVESFEKVDVTLVDKMINGVDNSQVKEEIAKENLLDEKADSDTIEAIDELETIEPIEIEESTAADFEDIDENSEDLLQEEETVDNDLSVDDMVSEVEDSLALEDTPLEESLPEGSEQLLIEEEISPPEELFEEDEEEESPETALKEEAESSETGNPIYECFNFEPETEEVDCDEILSELNTFDEKHPEKKIIEVCRLKYNENLSVSEISKTTGLSENEVLDSLNEIIFLVKD